MATEDMARTYVPTDSVAAQVESIERERNLLRTVVDALREHRDIGGHLLAIEHDAEPMTDVTALTVDHLAAWQRVLAALADVEAHDAQP